MTEDKDEEMAPRNFITATGGSEKKTRSKGTLLSRGKDAFVRHIKVHTTLLVLAALTLVLFYHAVQSPWLPSWLLVPSDEWDNSKTVPLTRWDIWTTRAAEWEFRDRVRDSKDAQNWAGRQKMRKMRSEGSFWWDERAEQYFMSKLEASQIPANCSEAHVIAHPEWYAGLISTVHVAQVPMFLAIVRGHTFVPVSYPDERTPAFDGCGPTAADRNLQCYFNITSCNLNDDPRRAQALADPFRDENSRTTFDAVLMEEDEFFAPGGLTVVRSWKARTWDTELCVVSSSFSSFNEAYTFHKLSLWKRMGQSGKVGVVSTRDDAARDRQAHQAARDLRVDLVMVSLMSSWMFNRMPNQVKLVAEAIMSRYADRRGKSIWEPPVVAIHMRRTDKTIEDPYHREHGVYRPVEDFIHHMKEIEVEYGFEWPSIYLISDAGTARQDFVKQINGEDYEAPATLAPQRQQVGKRYVMHDWLFDENLQEKFGDHQSVPEDLKHDMQIHFLANLYIVEKIADHAIVTYSSNIGRFIGEIMNARENLAFADTKGPLVTSLDVPWYFSRWY